MNNEDLAYEQPAYKAERVDKAYSDALIERHRKYIAESGEETLDTRFQDVLKRSLLETELTPNGTRKALNYFRLSSLLSVCGFPARDIYREMNIPVYLPDEDCEGVVEVLESLSPAKRSKLKKIAYGLSPSWWRTKDARRLPPSDRAREVIRRRVSTVDRGEKLIPSLRRIWVNAGMTMTLETKELPDVARQLGISLHWLMQMEDHAPCCSMATDVDLILDAYGMMSRTARRCFCALIREVKKREETYAF